MQLHQCGLVHGAWTLIDLQSQPWFADTNILDKAARLVLKGIPLAPIHAITQAFILATATEATDQAWVIDEHGLWWVAVFFTLSLLTRQGTTEPVHQEQSSRPVYE